MNEKPDKNEPLGEREIVLREVDCHDCGEVFMAPGSQWKYCDFCKTDDLRCYIRERDFSEKRLAEARALAEARIDRLDQMLLSRGLHLSQNPLPA